MKNFFKKDFFKILILFVFWRVELFFIAFTSSSIIGQFGAKFPYFNERLVSSSLPHFVWSFGNFDGVHYLGIAKVGYAYQFTQAFFPVYPILIKIVSLFTLGNLLASALIISNVSFLIGLNIFYQLVKKNYHEKIATWSVIFLLLFPTSFYFGSVYTEGLFFLQIVAFFYLLDHKKTLYAALVGSIASATRLIGIFLVMPFLKERTKANLLSATIIPLGLLVYMVYLKIKFNNPFYFLTAQSVFGQERSSTGIVLLPQVFYRYLKIILTAQSGVVTAFFEVSSFLLALILLILAMKKVKKEWIIFSFIAILLPTLTGTFTSMPRYIVVAFPIYIVVAMIRNSIVKISILTVSIILLIIATLFFTQGYWIA